LSDIDIASRKASNTVENWEIVLHDSGVQLVDELMREDENYLNLELQERITKLQNLAKSSTLVPNTTDVVQQIIQNE